MTDDGIVEVHLLRPAGTDINMPLALALVSFVFVEYLGLRMLGFGYFGKFVRVRSLASGLSALFRFKLLDAFQGCWISFSWGRWRRSANWCGSSASLSGCSAI